MDNSMGDDVPDYSNFYPHHGDNNNASYSLDYHYSFSSYFMIYDFGFDQDSRKIIYTVSFFILILLVVFGLLSNLLQLYSIIAFPLVRQKVENILIANLTVVDLMYLLSVGLSNLVLCGWEAFGDTDSLFSSVNFLVLFEIFLQLVHTAVAFHLGAMIVGLSVQQFLLAVYPMSARLWLTPRTATKAVVILWLVGFFIVLADGLPYTHILQYYHSSDMIALIKDCLGFIVLCLLPIIIFIALDLKTWSTLRNARSATRPAADNQRAHNAQRFTQLGEEGGGPPGALVRVKDLPNISALSASFVVCWVLYYTIHLVTAFIWSLKGFTHPIYDNNKDIILLQLADLMVHFNVALNPLLFVVCNPKVWKHMSRVLYFNRPSYIGHVDETDVAAD